MLKKLLTWMGRGLAALLVIVAGLLLYVQLDGLPHFQRVTRPRSADLLTANRDYPTDPELLHWILDAPTLKPARACAPSAESSSVTAAGAQQGVVGFCVTAMSAATSERA
jgi:hypothetical protein